MASNQEKIVAGAGLSRDEDDSDAIIIQVQDDPEDLVLLEEPAQDSPVLILVQDKSPSESSDVLEEEQLQQEENIDDDQEEENIDDDREHDDDQFQFIAPQPSTSKAPDIPIKKRPRQKKSGENDPKPAAKKARKSEIDPTDIRRSGRERHAKKYIDFVDDDDEDLDEGDGLTNAQREQLNRRIEKIGTTKTWRKKIPIIIGETAKMPIGQSAKMSLQPTKAVAVTVIEQKPSRPSTAIKKYFVPIQPPQIPSSEHCRFLFRPQDTFGVDMANNGGSEYVCDKCQFTSTRINNMVRHQLKDCVFNKDFFSWTDDTFSEATQRKKKPVAPKKKLDLQPIERLDSGGEEAVPSPQPGPSNTAVDKPTSATVDVELSCSEESDSEDDPLAKKSGYKKHDIVWVAQASGIHWPALVLKVTSRGQLARARTNTIEVRLLLIHNGQKTNALISRIEGFDSPRRQAFLEEGQKQKAALATEHTRAAQKADKFLRERVLGMNIDPVRFFRLGETKLIQEHETSSSEDNDTPDDTNITAQWELIQPDEAEMIQAHSNAKNAEISKKAKRQRKIENNVLIEFITGGKVEPHLVGIYRGTVPSGRHDLFNSGNEAQREKLRQSPWWGPIDDDKQQEIIYEYCHELIQRACEEAQDLDTIKYAFEVFCPEAITKAISKLALVDMEKAAEIFNKGADVVRKCQEFQKLARQPDPAVAQFIQKAMSKNDNLNTSEVVREELQRMGVDTDLLAEIDQ